MNKSYCPLVFDEIFSHNTGSYNVCCWAKRESNNLTKYKTKDTSPFQFFLSKEMNDIREKMLNGEKISICQNCYDEEKNIGYSVRTNKIKQYKTLPKTVEKVKLKLRIFGNYCNLSCIMCAPYNSSTRKKELTDTNLNYVFGNETYGGNSNTQWSIVKKDIIENAHLIEQLHLTGGEPLQSPQHWKLLIDELPKDKAKNIELYYDTNLTELTYNNYSVYDLFERFKKVEFGVSCDHYKDKLKFARYPINIDKFENNLMQVNKNIKSLNCTVHILNIFDLQEIKDYYKNNFNLYLATPSYVRGPRILSIKNLPKTLKEKFIQKYEKFNDAYFISELKKEGDYKFLQDGINYLNILGKHRDIDWKLMWPEIKDIKENDYQ